MARGLALACKGKPAMHNSGGRVAQLKLLRAGRHPVTREPLPPAIDELGKCLLYDRAVAVADEQLKARKGNGEAATTTIDYPSASHSSYVGGSSASEKMRQRLERIRAKEKLAKESSQHMAYSIKRTRLRGKQTPVILSRSGLDQEWTICGPLV